MLHFFHSILFYHIRHKVDKIGKILKNMPAVEKDQNSRAKGHDQKPSFFLLISGSLFKHIVFLMLSSRFK